MKILIVDDEKNIRLLMGRFLSLEGIDSDCAENAYSAQRFLRENTYDACLIDLRMPGMDGLELIEWVRNEGFRMPIIMASAHGEIQDAVKALKSGAQDYIIKPFDPDEVVIKLKAIVEAQNLKNIRESQDRSSTGFDFIGQSVQIRRIKDLISKIAPSMSTVLITGESGTGKEVVARTIHSLSSVSSGPFVAINIGGIPENLLESELFGYEKGAFTGAVSRKTGMFELANGGTLFLDEIGDMPLLLQVKLLRVLQDKAITRLGAVSPIPINARIICATNKDLETMVQEKKFREDLFYRLNVVRIQIPPLRERKDDIPLLAMWILQKLNSSTGKKITGFTPDAIDALRNHVFHGNVRELENIIERGAIFADGDYITLSDIELSGKNENNAGNDYTEGLSLKDMEIKTIEKALRRWEGNRTKAAEELGISRRTLITKIQDYGLEDVK